MLCGTKIENGGRFFTQLVRDGNRGGRVTLRVTPAKKHVRDVMREHLQYRSGDFERKGRVLRENSRRGKKTQII